MNVEDAKFEAINAKAAPVPKGKTKIGVNPEGWNIYVDTDDASGKAKEAEAGTPCGMDHTKTCNHALCKSKTVARTPTWSPLPTQPGFAADSASTRDTVAPCWFSRLAGVQEGTEIAFDTSAPGFAEADRAARLSNMSMAEAEKTVKEEGEKIAREMTDAADKAAEQVTKASKKRILMLMKEQKERERQEAEEAREKAAEDLRKLEEELAGL